MIAIDTSAIVAIALAEPEEEAFNRIVATQDTLVGTPTLFETHLVLTKKVGNRAEGFMERFLRSPSVRPVEFSLPMYHAAVAAFDRYGRGRHRAKLNFGDCMAYAIARAHDVPLLYKGADFAHTDIAAALP